MLLQITADFKNFNVFATFLKRFIKLPLFAAVACPLVFRRASSGVPLGFRRGPSKKTIQLPIIF